MLLSRARPDRRGAVLGLNSAVTYLGAMLGTGGAGLLYALGGFPADRAAAAAALVAAAALLAGNAAGAVRRAVVARAPSAGG